MVRAWDHLWKRRADPMPARGTCDGECCLVAVAAWSRADPSSKPPAHPAVMLLTLHHSPGLGLVRRTPAIRCGVWVGAPRAQARGVTTQARQLNRLVRRRGRNNCVDGDPTAVRIDVPDNARRAAHACHTNLVRDSGRRFGRPLCDPSADGGRADPRWFERETICGSAARTRCPRVAPAAASAAWLLLLRGRERTLHRSHLPTLP
jgi:hypothetical protein